MARETYVYRDGKLIPKHLAPPRHSPGRGLQVIKDIDPYRNIAVDNGVISGRRQHRDMLRAHGLIEVGDQAPTAPPKPPPNVVDRGLVETIKRAMGKY
jgi:hypothetical protein